MPAEAAPAGPDTQTAKGGHPPALGLRRSEQARRFTRHKLPASSDIGACAPLGEALRSLRSVFPPLATPSPWGIGALPPLGQARRHLQGA